MSNWSVVDQEGPAQGCAHIEGLPGPPSPATECEDCVREGTQWVHLRACLTCQHVGCCNSSPRRHADAHWHQSTHPVAASAERGEHWAWCFPDRALLVPAS